MDNTTGALIGIGLANVATLVTMWLKNSADARKERDRLAAETVAAAAALNAERERVKIETEKEIRHRQWEIEDRDRLASHVKETSNILAAKVEQTSTLLAAKVENSEAAQQSVRRTIIELLNAARDDIAETKKISTDAFHEANGAKMLLAQEVAKRNAMAATPRASRRATDAPIAGPVVVADVVVEPSAMVAATTELAAQTGASAEATEKLADQIETLGAIVPGVPSLPTLPVLPELAKDIDERMARNEQLGIAAAGLLVEIADRSKGIERNTQDTADTLKSIDDAPKPKPKPKP